MVSETKKIWVVAEVSYGDYDLGLWAFTGRQAAVDYMLTWLDEREGGAPEDYDQAARDKLRERIRGLCDYGADSVPISDDVALVLFCIPLNEGAPQCA